jgi:hypothetical protein
MAAIKEFNAMKNGSRKPKEPQPSATPLLPKEGAPLQPAGEIVVSPQETAAQAPAGKRIHQRRPLPPVPEAGTTPQSDEPRSDA